jgi:MFS family permease
MTAVGAISGPVIGGLLGRERRPKRGFVASIALAAFGALVLGIGMPTWPLPALVVVAGLMGLAYPALTGGWSAQVRRIAPEIAPNRSYAVDVGTYNVADVIGPAIIGVAVLVDTAIPGATSLETVSLLYLIGMAVLMALPIPEREDLAADRESLGTALRRLEVVLLSLPLLRSYIVGTVTIIATGTFIVAMPLLGEGLADDPNVGALLLSVVAAGAVLGSVALTRVRIQPQDLEKWMYGGVAGVAVCFAGLAAAPSLGVAIALLAVLGVAGSPMITAIFTIRDREASAAARSIVFMTAASLRTGGVSIGTLIAASLLGGVGTLPGWRVLLMACTAITLLAAVAALAVRRPLRPPLRAAADPAGGIG